MFSVYSEDSEGDISSEYIRYTKRWRRTEPGSEPEEVEDDAMSAAEKGQAASAAGDWDAHAAAEEEFISTLSSSDETAYCLLLTAISSGFLEVVSQLASTFDVLGEHREIAADMVMTALSTKDVKTVDHVLDTVRTQTESSHKEFAKWLESVTHVNNDWLGPMDYAVACAYKPGLVRVLFKYGHGLWITEKQGMRLMNFYQGDSWLHFAAKTSTGEVMTEIFREAQHRGDLAVLTWEAFRAVIKYTYGQQDVISSRWQALVSASPDMWADFPAGPPPKNLDHLSDWMRATCVNDPDVLSDGLRFVEYLQQSREGPIS